MRPGKSILESVYDLQHQREKYIFEGADDEVYYEVCWPIEDGLHYSSFIKGHIRTYTFQPTRSLDLNEWQSQLIELLPKLAKPKFIFMLLTMYVLISGMHCER